MVFNNSILLGAAGQGGAVAPFDSSLVGNSIWLEGKETSGDAMTRTWGTESNQDRWIWATWYQPLRVIDAVANRNNIFASGNASGGFYLRHNSTASTFNIFHRDNAGTEGAINTTESYRDLSSWIHVLVDYDSANANAENRISLYINGVRTGVNSGNRPGQNNHLNTNVSGQTARIGQDLSTTPNYHVQGYLAQTIFLDNKSIANGDLAITDFLDTFTFGTNGSQIVPKSNTDIIALASAAGNNSFCLDYSDSSNIVNDASSKGNNFTPTGGGSPTITSANQSISTPSKTYSVFNPLAHADNSYPGTFTLSDGNQKNVINSSNTSVKTTMPFIMSGSNIIRTQFTFTTAGHGGCGITSSRHTAGTYHTAGDSIAGDGEVVLLQNGALSIDGNFNNSYFSGFSNGDVVDVIVNCDVGAVYFAVNGTLLSSATESEIQAGTTTNAALVSSFVRRKAGQVFNFYAVQFNPTSTTIEYNSGQSSFTHSYSTITSLKSLNTADLPAPEYQGIDYFDATIYEGNGTGQRVGDFVPFTDAYTVDNSAMFEHDDARYLSRTIEAPSSSGGKKGTWSVWFKTANIDTDNVFFDNGTTATNRFSLNMDASGQIIFSHKSVTILKTSANFKGDGSWHNAVLKVDTSQGTASNRAAMFIDGVEITSFEEDRRDDTNLSQNDEIGYMDESATQFVGSYNGSSANQWDGYLAEVGFLDDQYLDASSFGQLDTSTNRWVNKSVSGLTFGNCGFYLEFEGNFSSTSLGNDAGKDSSGNGNHFAQGGTWAASDQFTDTPSKNYPIVDSGNKFGSVSPAVSEGNLRFTAGGDGGGRVITMQPTSGKWYFEIELTNTTGFYPGLITPAAFAYTGSAPWNETSTFVILSDHPSVRYNNGGTSGSDWGAAFSNGDRMAVAWDVPNGKIYFGKAASSSVTWMSASGASGGNPATGVGAVPFTPSLNERLYFAMMFGSNSTDATMKFISSGWEGAAPTGFSELNQDNLDDTASKLTAWAWIKNRDASDSHVLIDRVRGIGVEVHTDGTTTTPETTNMNTVQRFLQRGVQVGNDVQVNTANESYVLWQWLVGDSATTGSSIGAGSISTGVPSLASTALAADAGHFSVVSWTGNTTAGATVGHGMGGTPEFIIAIARAENGENKPVYHKFMTSDNDHLKINEVNAQGTAGTTIWDVSAMSSTLIGLGAAAQSNSTNGMIAYCFRSVPGVCKVGKYSGNGSADGPYISLGFTPRWIFSKRIDSSSDGAWWQFDTGRDTNGNVNDLYLRLNGTNTEPGAGNTPSFDFLADGFKSRSTYAGTNASDSEYLYMAMADIGGNGTLPPIYGR